MKRATINSMRNFTSVLAAISLAGFAASTAFAGAEACCATKAENCCSAKADVCCASKAVANLKAAGTDVVGASWTPATVTVTAGGK